LHRLPHFRFVGQRLRGGWFHVNNKPIRFREPANSCAAFSRRRIHLKIHFLFAAFQLIHNAFAISMQNVSEKIQFDLGGCPVGTELILGMQVRKQNSTRSVRDHQWTVKGV
jgi:hypothetical protein